MIKMVQKNLDLPACEQSLLALEAFLSSNLEIEETGAGGLQEFFENHPDLLLLMGDCFFPSLSPHYYGKEFSILGEFRADFAISDKSQSKFLFVEFESAKTDSVFVTKYDGKTITSYDWSPRFEHGFSQVVDWQYRMDDLGRTSRLEEHFGSAKVDHEGILVVGRDHFVKKAGCLSRLAWRKEKVVINSKRVHCLTFDGLLIELRGRYDAISEVLAGNL